MTKKIITGALASLAIGSTLFAAPVRTTSTTTTLTATQKAALLFMYQEEKVARDVYITLGKKYPTANTFANIALSEQAHADSVEKLCIKYKVDISKVNESSVGNFILPELQALYNTMVIQGSITLTEGLKTGIAIEEKDIADIMTYAAGMPSDVVKVFENLKAGSYSHLVAFQKAYSLLPK